MSGTILRSGSVINGWRGNIASSSAPQNGVHCERLIANWGRLLAGLASWKIYQRSGVERIDKGSQP